MVNFYNIPYPDCISLLVVLKSRGADNGHFPQRDIAILLSRRLKGFIRRIYSQNHRFVFFADEFHCSKSFRWALLLAKDYLERKTRNSLILSLSLSLYGHGVFSAFGAIYFSIRLDEPVIYGRNDETNPGSSMESTCPFSKDKDLGGACGPHFSFNIHNHIATQLSGKNWSARFIAFDDQSQNTYTVSVDPQNPLVSLSDFQPQVGPGYYFVSFEVDENDGNGYSCYFARSDNSCPGFHLEVHDDVPALDFSIIPDRICPDDSVFIVLNHQHVIGTKYSINPNYDNQPPDNLQDLPYDDFSGAGFEYNPLKVDAFRQQYSMSILPGIHSIQITAENACGVKEQTRDFEVGLDIDFTADDVCFGEPVAFQAIDYCDPSDYGILYESTWKWDFGDGNIATYAYNNQHIPLIHHTYNSPGVYSVSLTATMKNPVDNSVVTTNTVTKDLEVYLTPEVPAVTGHFNNCDDPEKEYVIDNYNSSYNYTISVDPPAFGTVHYTGGNTFSVNWDFSSQPNAYADIVVEVEDMDSECNNFAEYRVVECCEGEGNDTHINNAVYSQLPQSVKDELLDLSYKSFYINGVFILDEDITVENAVFFCGGNAKFKIADNVAVDFDNVEIKAYCEYMWDGIYVTSSNSSIDLKYCTLSDAQQAVVSSNGGVFTIEDSYINASYKGLVVSSYNPIPNYPDPYVPHPGSITGSTITGSDALAWMPYENEQSYVGVEVDKVNELTIGDQTDAASQNVFQSLFCGIKAINSYTKVYNNKFVNIREAPSSAPVPPAPFDPVIQPSALTHSAAIFSISPSGGYTSFFQDKLLVKGNHSGANGNMFDDFNRGIQVYNQPSDIRNNTFKDGFRSVIVYQPMSTRVQHNTIGTSAYPVSRGVEVISFQKKLSDVNVSNNTIHPSSHGISFHNLRGGLNSEVYSHLQVRTNSNTIIFDPANYSFWRYGIRLENCESSRVRNNEVYRGGSPPQSFKTMYGISLSNSMLCDVWDNSTLKNMGGGIRLAGNCNFTKIYCNEMESCRFGIVFDSHASITQMGSPSRRTDNRWFGNYDSGQNSRKMGKNPYGVGIGSSNVPWYIKYGEINDPTSDYNPEVVDMHELYSHINPVDSDESTGSQCFSAVTIDPFDLENLRDEYFAMMLDQGFDYDYLEEEYSFYDAQFLYKLLREDPTLIDLGTIEDPKFVAFYDSIQQTVIEDIEALNNLIEAEDINEAIIANEELDISRGWNANLQKVNRLYINKFIRGDYDLTEDELEMLWGIALTIPEEGGDAVYIARAMLGVDPDSYEEIYYDGEAEEGALAGTPVGKIKIYPNPASGQVNVRIFDDPEDHDVITRIYDLNGRMIQRHNHGNSTYFTINVDELSNGLYFLRVTNDANINETLKLIVHQ